MLRPQVEEMFARSLMPLKHTEVAAVMSALGHIDIPPERDILLSSPLLAGGRLSFLGLSGVYCKQQLLLADVILVV